jgi:hypothetical protein
MRTGVRGRAFNHDSLAVEDEAMSGAPFKKTASRPECRDVFY